MRLLVPLTALVVTAVVGFGLADARQDDAPQRRGRSVLDLTDAEKAELQTKAMELANPGEEHALLAKYAGTFDQEISLFLEPGAPPIKSTAVGEHEMILGGRFLQTLSKGVMEIPGLKLDVELLQIWGFDRRSARFTSVGFDTMGTYYVTGEGDYDPETRTATLSGRDYDAALDMEQVFDFVLEFVDDDTLKTSVIFHDMIVPGPFTLMESVSRRRKE